MIPQFYCTVYKAASFWASQYLQQKLCCPEHAQPLGLASNLSGIRCMGSQLTAAQLFEMLLQAACMLAVRCNELLWQGVPMHCLPYDRRQPRQDLCLALHNTGRTIPASVRCHQAMMAQSEDQNPRLPELAMHILRFRWSHRLYGIPETSYIPAVISLPSWPKEMIWQHHLSAAQVICQYVAIVFSAPWGSGGRHLTNMRQHFEDKEHKRVHTCSMNHKARRCYMRSESVRQQLLKRHSTRAVTQQAWS